jgi:hypothetical protein
MSDITLTRAAPAVVMDRAAPASLDGTARTVEALVATAAPIAMKASLNPTGSAMPWRERLDFAGADWTRFAIAPVLLKHGSTDVNDQIGSVETFAVRGDALYATLLFGERPEAAAIFNDIAKGAVRGVSIGYTVQKYGPPVDAGDGGPPVFPAIAWTPYEVTIVAVPADPATGIRAFAAPPLGMAARPADYDLSLEFLPADPAFRRSLIDIARRIKPDFKEDFTMTDHARSGDGGAAPDMTRGQYRSAIWSALSADSPPTNPAQPTPQFDRDIWNSPAVRAREAMAEALACRGSGAEPGEHAREFMGMRIHEMAREVLRDQPGLNRALLHSPARVIERAMHTTSDFPLLLGTASTRILLDAYKRAAPAIKACVRIRQDVPDFRTINVIRLAGMSRLQQVNEHGEITAGTATEAGESYKVTTFARVFAMTREAMVNDDLGALQSVHLMGGAAAETEAAEIVALLAANTGAGPTMKDGNPLFRTAANNLANAGTALDITNVAAAVAAMRTQTDPGGNLVAVDPAIILVGPQMELAARQIVAAINPTQIGNANPYTSAFTVVVEPRLTGRQWFVFSNPAAAAGRR